MDFNISLIAYLECDAGLQRCASTLRVHGRTTFMNEFSSEFCRSLIAPLHDADARHERGELNRERDSGAESRSLDLALV